MQIDKTLIGVRVELTAEDTLESLLENWARIQKMLDGVKPKRYTTIDCLKDEELVKEMMATHLLSEQTVRDKIADLVGYCQANGRKYSNYKAALNNFIRGDLKRGVIKKEVVKPKPEWMKDPEISEEQRQSNLQMLKDMRAKHNL